MAGKLVRLDKNPGMMEDPPITQWLFNSTYAAWGWLAVRLYVGYQWVTAGEHKVTDPAWMSTGEALKGFTKIVHKFCQANESQARMKEFTGPLSEQNKKWGDITVRIGMRAMQNPDEVGAVSVDYIYFAGYVTLAYIWAWTAKVALDQLERNPTEAAFYTAKIQTAQFYFKKILPRVQSHLAGVDSGLEVIQQMDETAFAF